MKRTSIRPTTARIAVSVGFMLLSILALILLASPGADAAGISKPPANRPALNHSSDEHWSDLFDIPGLGVEDYEVFAVAIHGTDVYIGGRFNSVGGIAANGIARLDTIAQQWHPMGLGVAAGCLGSLATVSAIAIDAGGTVYIGGDFEYVNGAPAQGGVQANGFAMWNGSAWQPIGTDNAIGATGATCADVSALGFQGGTLYIGGLFDHFGGVQANNVARMVGGAVSALAGDPSYGADWTVDAFAFDGADVYMGGGFTSAGGVASSHVIKYSGGAFQGMGGGVDYDVHSLAVLNGRVYAGGAAGASSVSLKQYYQTGGQNSAWTWDTVGGGVTYGGGNTGSVEGMAVYQGDLLIGGYFTYAGGNLALGVARWKPNTETWDTLGNGINLSISGSIVADVATTGAQAYVVGEFPAAGGKPSYNIALYDEDFIPTPIPPQADVQVSIEADAERVNAGDALHYCVFVDNLGPDPAENVQLITVVPAGTTLAEVLSESCDGGGGGESFASPGHSSAPRRTAGLAMPLLEPNCTAPALGSAGAINCTLPDLAAYDSYVLAITVNVTGAPGSDIGNNASVTSTPTDPVSDNNSDSVTVHVRPAIVYVSADGNCAGQTPCLTSIDEGMYEIAQGGTLNILAGAYSESLYLDNDLTANLLGNVSLSGDLYLYSGALNAGSGVLSVTGNLDRDGGAFNRQTGTIRFNGSSTQYITGAFQFHNVVVAQGAVLDLQNQPLDYDGTFTNEGTVLFAQEQDVVPNTPTVFQLGTNQPMVLVQTASGALGYTNVTITLGAEPQSCFGNAFPVDPLLRQFEISPSISDPTEVTLRLYYDASELGTIAPDSLSIYHCDSTTQKWEKLGGTLGSENGQTYIEFSGTTGFSPFGLGGSAGPTSTMLERFGGSAQGNAAHLTWATANEFDLMGFNLWRSADAQKGYTQLNPALIPPQNPGALTGAEYAWDDTTVTSGTYYYKLEMVRAGDKHETTAPVAVTLGDACANGLGVLNGVRPKNGAQLKKAQAVIKWQPAACATTYQVTVRVGSPNGRVVFSRDALTKHRVKFKQLTPNKWYYVIVRACSDGACGEWSAAHKFRYKK